MNFANLIKKLFALIVAFFVSIGVISGPEKPSDGIKADAQILFSDSDPGCAAGKVSVSSNYDGTYNLFWADENGNKLSTVSKPNQTVTYSYFADVDVKNGNGEANLNEFLAIPEGAKSVLLYYGDELLDEDKLPETKINSYDGEIYSFGALSDVHFNRYSKTSSDDASESFPRALGFLNDIGVSMVGVCGDLSSRGESSAYEKFNEYSSKYPFPVFSWAITTAMKSLITTLGKQTSTPAFIRTKREAAFWPFPTTAMTSFTARTQPKKTFSSSFRKSAQPMLRLFRLSRTHSLTGSHSNLKPIKTNVSIFSSTHFSLLRAVTRQWARTTLSTITAYPILLHMSKATRTKKDSEVFWENIKP